MDNFEENKPVQQEDDEVNAIWVTEDVRSYLYDMSRWCKFLAIVGFVFSAMVAISALSVGALMSTLATVSPANPLLKLGSAGLTIFYLIIAALQFYPSLMLFKFAKSSTAAVFYADQESFGEAMRKLKSFFKFCGIVTLIVISLYVMMIVMVAVIGASAAML